MDRRLSIAPMMDWTDRHCRAFHRALTSRALLYTEMVTAPAVIHGERQRLLGFDAVEHPVALQLGGSDPEQLAEAARIGEAFGYDEINLNVGCPSDRVQSGRFGACLMREPALVADCMAAIKAAATVPATVKCRIGVDDQDPEVSLFETVDACAAVGIEVFIVHARKAWLQGLSPKENRDVPPLDYGLVRRLKRERPHLSVTINGGVASLDEAEAHLDASDGVRLDGVMLGRAAYHEPAILGQADRRLFGTDTPDVDAFAAIEADPNQMLVVATAGERVVGTLQISFIPGLSRKGMWRGQIEGVRIAADLRGSGLGRRAFEWAIEACRARGCALVQLTTDRERPEAHSFYEQLGFTASHLGYKKAL